MPDSPEPPTTLPQSQPILGDGNSPANPPLEIPPDILGKLEEITVTRGEVSRLAANDKCLHKLIAKLNEAKTAAMPTRGQIEAQKKIAAMELQKVRRLQSARQQRAATVQMLEAQVRQRLTIIQEKEEARKVRAIRGRLAPQYRPPASSLV